MGTIIAQFFVPVFEVLVRNFAVRIEYQNAHVGAVVVGRVQLVEGLLASCVPNVYS
jgi:hypothetical protein